MPVYPATVRPYAPVMSPKTITAGKESEQPQEPTIPQSTPPPQSARPHTRPTNNDHPLSHPLSTP